MTLADTVATIREHRAEMVADRDRLTAAIDCFDKALAILDPGPAAPTVKPAKKAGTVPANFDAAITRRQDPKPECRCEPCDRTFRSPAGLGAHRTFAHGPESAGLAPVRPVHRPNLGKCSCGMVIVDADDWGRHNETVVRPGEHRLNRTEAAS